MMVRCLFFLVARKDGAPKASPPPASSLCGFTPLGLHVPLFNLRGLKQRTFNASPDPVHECPPSRTFGAAGKSFRGFATTSATEKAKEGSSGRRSVPWVMVMNWGSLTAGTLCIAKWRPRIDQQKERKANLLFL